MRAQKHITNQSMQTYIITILQILYHKNRNKVFDIGKYLDYNH